MENSDLVPNLKAKGDAGEDIAVNHLLDNGYNIKKKKFTFGKNGEIDIIAEKDGMIIFIEVKTRKSFAYGELLESVPYFKQKQVRKVAEGYLYVNRITNIPCRFDFIGIDISGEKPKLMHLENAF